MPAEGIVIDTIEQKHLDVAIGECVGLAVLERVGEALLCPFGLERESSVGAVAQLGGGRRELLECVRIDGRATGKTRRESGAYNDRFHAWVYVSPREMVS